MTSYRLLKESFSRIATESTWTQRSYARNLSGAAVSFVSDEAVCFDAEGTVLKTGRKYDRDMQPELKLLDQAAFILIGKAHAILLNDSGSHAMVMRMFAIAESQALLDGRSLEVAA